MSRSDRSRRDSGTRHRQSLVRRVQSAMTTVFDPATPHIDLFNMGMIYDIRVHDDDTVVVDLAFSSPGHPGNLELPKKVRDTVNELEGVAACQVKVVSEPRWTLDRVSDYARVHMRVSGDAD